MACINRIGASSPDGNELLQGCSGGDCYKENQGLLNVNFSENSETPAVMSEEEIKAHIVGVVPIYHFNINKGIAIFLAIGPRLQ